MVHGAANAPIGRRAGESLKGGALATPGIDRPAVRQKECAVFAATRRTNPQIPPIVFAAKENLVLFSFTYPSCGQAEIVKSPYGY